jgi:extracellular factor (EF) 3-hydroxypalmitic acid methyl ester biosynthesis protein
MSELTTEHGALQYSPFADVAEFDVTAFLDAAERKIRGGDAAQGMGFLLTGLRDLRLSSDSPCWEQIVERCLAHPIRALLHEDPLTARAFHKPRGYAGDAVLLDYIYSPDRLSAKPDMSPLGALVWEHIVEAPCCEAARRRRRQLALTIDQAAERRAAARVLSVAAGHLREAELSIALRLHHVEELVALDQDLLSLRVIAHDYAALPVTPLHGTAQQLVRGELMVGDFDLVYAAGIFDYLRDSTAVALFRQMVHMTRPGGEVLIANILPGHPGVGYMEAYMGWTLVYRTLDELCELANMVDPNVVDQVSLHKDGLNTVGYLSVRRR